MAEIKRAAKDGQMEAVRVMAQITGPQPALGRQAARPEGAAPGRVAQARDAQVDAGDGRRDGRGDAGDGGDEQEDEHAGADQGEREEGFFFSPLPGAFSVLFFSVAPSPLFFFFALTFRTLSSANRSCATSSARTSAWRPPRR